MVDSSRERKEMRSAVRPAWIWRLRDWLGRALASELTIDRIFLVATGSDRAPSSAG